MIRKFGKRKNSQSEEQNWEYSYENADSSGKNGKKRKKILLGVTAGILAAAAAVVVSSSWYSINEEEQAVVCTFGKPEAVTEPGLHFKIPLIQTVKKINTTIQGFAIGYSGEKYAPYEGMEGGTERFYSDEESLMITSDYNFINIDFYVEYRYSTR